MAHDAGLRLFAIFAIVDLAVIGQRSDQGIAAMVVAVGELGARIAGKAHDNAIEAHDGYSFSGTGTGTAQPPR